MWSCCDGMGNYVDTDSFITQHKLQVGDKIGQNKAFIPNILLQRAH